MDLRRTTISTLLILLILPAIQLSSIADLSSPTAVASIMPRNGNKNGNFEISVDPSSRSIFPGQNTHYKIEVEADGSFKVALTAQGIPQGAVGIFNPPLASFKGDFKSTLTVVTSVSTPPGLYTLTIFIELSNTETKTFQATAALEIKKPQTATHTTTTTTQTTQTTNGATTTIQNLLLLVLRTNKPIYTVNENVTISGQVSDISGNAVSGVSVSLQVVDPEGRNVHVAVVSTSGPGTFTDTFRLGGNMTGTFTIFGTANKARYIDGRSRTSFVVGVTTAPSISISTVVILNAAGNATSEFRAGATVTVSFNITNGGATLQNGMIWLEIDDPNGVPLIVIINRLQIAAALSTQIQWPLPSTAITGNYLVKIFVSDKPIKEGGRFMATSQIRFVVVAS